MGGITLCMRQQSVLMQYSTQGSKNPAPPEEHLLSNAFSSWDANLKSEYSSISHIFNYILINVNPFIMNHDENIFTFST